MRTIYQGEEIYGPKVSKSDEAVQNTQKCNYYSHTVGDHSFDIFPCHSE